LFIRSLTEIERVFIAASWNWQLASNAFKDALDEFLANQSQAGSKVYILEQEPLLTRNPLRTLRFKALGMVPNMGINPDYQESNIILQRLSPRYNGVTSLKFETSGIFNQAPFSNGILIYLDEHHLNEEGAKRYAKAAFSAFAEIID
jgi:lysophospholipase L1-like esterase